MLKRVLAAIGLTAVLMGVGGAGVVAQEPREPEVSNLWAFGDSLTDTGNLHFLSAGMAPPSPPYFNGRFSNGPVWIEPFAERLGLVIDFDIPFANNQAVAGAFTGLDGLFGAGTGVLSQVGGFLAAGGTFEPNDLVVVWAGANDYLFTPIAPPDAVENLALAVTELSDAGARRFLVPNLPNLGDTPLARSQGPAVVDGLSALTAAHNAILAEVMAQFADLLEVEIVMVDVNAGLREIFTRPVVFGFDNLGVPCLVQQPDGTRPPSGACPPDGATFDATGTLFWDLIHPADAAHALLAAFAHATLVAAESLPETMAGAADVATHLALGQMRAFGAAEAPRP
jgi:outer membrane lipase/esterase